MVKQNQILKTLILEDVLKEPLTISFGNAIIQLDATVTASVIMNGLTPMEINEYDFKEIYMRVHGLFDELVKLDMKSFCIHQKGLYEAFCKAVEVQIMKRAVEADDSDWNYIHEET